MKSLCLAVAAMTVFAVSAQSMYRWVDENGRVHYTDTPPPGTSKGEKIEVKPTPPSAPVAPPSDARTRDLETRGERAQKAREAQKAAYDEARSAEIRKARCRDAQGQLQVLRMQRPVFQTNEKGERVFLDDKDRQAELDKWQERAKTYCE
jgi:hypothetical protein